jgi:hypothetical protein
MVLFTREWLRSLFQAIGSYLSHPATVLSVSTCVATNEAQDFLSALETSEFSRCFQPIGCLGKSE